MLKNIKYHNKSPFRHFNDALYVLNEIGRKRVSNGRACWQKWPITLGPVAMSMMICAIGNYFHNENVQLHYLSPCCIHCNMLIMFLNFHYKEWEQDRRHYSLQYLWMDRGVSNNSTNQKYWNKEKFLLISPYFFNYQYDHVFCNQCRGARR